MASALEPIVQKDFSGGLNLSVNPYLIPKKQLWRARNVLLDEHGSIRTRPGSALVWNDITTTSPLRYLKNLVKTDLSTVHWAIFYATPGAGQIWTTDATPYTYIGGYTLPLDYFTPQAVTVYNQEFIAIGYNTPKTFDGVTLADMVVQGGQVLPLGAKHVAFHLGSIWLWNTASTTSTLDGPSSLRMAAVGKVDDWPSANQSFIAKDDGQVGMGLASYTIVETGISPISTLVAFKNFSAYQISGVFGSTNFAIQQVKTDMGNIAPRSIQFVSGFGIIRLSHKGFALFNGVDDKLLSEDIRPAIFGNAQEERDILPLDFTNIDKSCAGQVQNPPLYVCACPVAADFDGTPGDGNLTRYFVFDLVRKAWTICDFPVAASWIGTLYENGQGNLYAGQSTNGGIYRLMGLNDTTDSGAKVDWSFRTGPINSGDSTGLLFFRRFLLDMVYPQGQSLNYNVTLNGYTSGLTGSRSLPLLVTAGRTDIDIMRTAPSIYATISGSGNIRVRGLTWQVRKKPLTRATL
jgi:hypothetical protein